MGKIVGKMYIIALVALFFMIALNAKMVMEIRPENGVRDQVVIGQPFIIDVTVDDVYGSVQAPEIKGLEKFNAHRTGMYMSSINGKAMTRYSYQVRIDAVGTYTIGPATVQHQQDKLVSNEVTISVVKSISPVQSNGKSAAHNNAKTFLRLIVDNDSVVVGQKVECTLRFYYQDNSITLNKIGIPELQGFDVKNMGNLESGTAEHNGVHYRYAQWRWDVYPTKPGELIIPAYNVDYEIPLNDNRSLGGFFMFMNTRVDHKRVYSNAATINVSALPPYAHSIDAIGVFERIIADIKPGVAKEGEGMVLVLEIEGIGNLDTIKTPSIVMPEALKYYESQNSIIMPKTNDELPKKRFEFIVQGMRQGDWEIPSQVFRYFDTEKNKYRVLRTSPLFVSIMAGTKHNKSTTIDCINENKDNAIGDIVFVDDIAHINVVGQWNIVNEKQPLQWWLFFLLLSLIGLYGVYPLILREIVLLHTRMAWSRKWCAYRKARKQIKLVYEFKSSENLYGIFIELLSSCGEHYSLKDVAHVLQERGFSVSLIQEWETFVSSITHAAYAKTDKSNEHINELCKAANQWIERLEKIL